MIVDFQKYWSERNRRIMLRILESVEAARAHGMIILWTYVLGDPRNKTRFHVPPPEQVGYRDVKDIFTGCARFSEDFYPAAQPCPEDFIAGKGPDETDAFSNQYLEDFLKVRGRTFVAGFMHSYCVYNTAQFGVHAKLPIVVLSGLTADKNDKIEAGKRDFEAEGICLRPVEEFPEFFSAL